MEYRTHTCGELRESNVGQKVKLSGWLAGTRDLGAVIFFVLRDFYGSTQAVASTDGMKELIRSIPRESTVSVEGKVILRSSPNPDMPTGMIEIEPEKVEVLGRCYEQLPFEIATSTQSRRIPDSDTASSTSGTPKSKTKSSSAQKSSAGCAAR